MNINVKDLLIKLINCKSVTPIDDGAIGIIVDILSKLNFECHVLEFHGVKNLYARYGKKGQNICFAGHTDVVPAGNVDWTLDPFKGEIKDGHLYGRGAVDMKGGIASFIGAIANFVQTNKDLSFSISVMITGNEEGDSVGGVPDILKWLKEKNEKIDFCMMGEPSSVKKIADAYKLGRRGSVNFVLNLSGIQGHIAEQEKPNNPIYKLAKLTTLLYEYKFDDGNKYFQPSRLQPSTFDVGNKTENIIPEKAELRFNVRFNNEHKAIDIIETVKKLIEKFAKENEVANYDLKYRISGEAFISKKTNLHDLLELSIEEITGNKPDANTTGGTSDLRFIVDICDNIVELGHINETMHKKDERVLVEDLETLTKIYESWLNKIKSL